MADKVVSLAEAVSLIDNGATVALGGNTIHRSPCAALAQMIRQGKKDLTVVKTAGAYDVDLLCGAGLVRAVIAAYVGFENFGLAPRFRRGVESGAVKLHEHT